MLPENIQMILFHIRKQRGGTFAHFLKMAGVYTPSSCAPATPLPLSKAFKLGASLALFE